MTVAIVVVALYFIALGGGVFLLLLRARRSNYAPPAHYRSTEVLAHRVPLPGTRKHEAT